MTHEESKVRPVLVSCAGALGSLALHILLIAPVVMGFRATAKRSPLNPSKTERMLGDDFSPAMTATLIGNPDPMAQDTRSAGTPPPTIAPPLRSVYSPTPPPKYNLATKDDADTNHDAVGEPSQPNPGREALVRRYIDQITARIERAWMRPRAPIDSALFKCRVRVTQDQHGVVEEIELVRCNESARWQTSLVQAIQSASPLPAPPDVAVFTGQLTLDLQSATFTPGDTADGFEPETRTIGLSPAALRQSGPQQAE